MADLPLMDGRFEPLGASHLLALAVTLVGLLPVVLTGRRHRYADPSGRAATRAGWVMVAVVVPLQLYDFLPGRFALERTLPIQLSDLAWMSAAVALLTRRRWAVALTYYWGLTLSLQAILTPSLAEDVPDPRYWAFWTSHTIVIWVAAYLTWGRGLRPAWRDYRLVVAVTSVWLVVVLAFNAVADTNYGYVTRKPAAASALDHLGPWPVYLLAEIVILVSVWALMTWPWVRDRRPVGGVV